jgi:hypothetical protein
MADVKISELSSDSSIGGSEEIPVNDSGTTKKITTDAMAAYTIDELVGATEVTPTTGDAVLMERSGTEGTFDLDDLADYAVARGWGAASEADPAVSGDMILVDRSGTVYEIDVDTLTTYVTSGLQASTLDISGLDSATVSATDLFLVCESGTGKKATLTEVETQLWADLATYLGSLTDATSLADANELYGIQSGTPKAFALDDISDYVVANILADDDLTDDILDYFSTYTTALDATTALADADVMYLLQSGTAKKTTIGDISDYIVDQAQDRPWSEVNSSKYTATPPSTSTITMSDTTDFEIGYPVKYTYGGQTYYGVVTAISANSLLTIAGPALNVAQEVTALYAGTPERVIYKDFFIDTAAFNAAQDIFSAVTYQRYRWNMGPAYLVSFSGTLGSLDTGANQPKINVKVAGNLVSTDDSNKGLTLSSVAGTWVDNTAATVSSSYYDIDRHDAVDIRCTEAGTNGDAYCLTATLVFVLE